MKTELTEDNTCRLAKALIERYGITYEEAMYKLASFRLNLVCDQSIASSIALQAALITAVNTGKRAFHGGVHVMIPEGVPSRFPWPGQPSLAAICSHLGAKLEPLLAGDMIQTIFFGQPHHPKADDLLVSATGWRGGVSPATAPICISSPIDFALGGTIAGALAVAKGFFRIAGIDIRHHMDSAGVSLWDPSADWREEGSDRPYLQYLPQKLWILGLGHLGQAYLWTLGLLPYAESQKAEFLLQDFDRVVVANLGTGLLCSAESVGRLKTRLCAEWMENRRLRTRIIEDRSTSASCQTMTSLSWRCAVLIRQPQGDFWKNQALTSLSKQASVGTSQILTIYSCTLSRTPPRSLKKFGVSQRMLKRPPN